MRILAVLSLITAVLFSPMIATKAEAQCLLCGVVGFALGSASNDEQAGALSGSNVIYVAPHIGERIADPLDVKVIASEDYHFKGGNDEDDYQGASLRTIFANTVYEHEKYTILEIVRLVNPKLRSKATFWFAFIENEKMRPLSEFPSN